MISFYLLSFFSGGLVQLTDFLVDKRRLRVPHFEFISSFWAGLIIGYLVSSHPVFSTVFLGVIAANLLLGKVNAKAHILMFVPMLVVLAARGVAAPNLLLLALFACTAMLDEFLHDKATRKEKKLAGKKKSELASMPMAVAHFMAENRLFTDLFALGVSLATGDATYFLAMASFDAGYLFSAKVYA